MICECAQQCHYIIYVRIAQVVRVFVSRVKGSWFEPTWRQKRNCFQRLEVRERGHAQLTVVDFFVKVFDQLARIDHLELYLSQI